ncbi:MAG: ABC transporter permease, partial [Puniceicoccales bacterium]
MSTAPTNSPGQGIAQRILHHPPALASLGVFLLITFACWIVPAFWTHNPNETRLSLGATSPLATLYTLTSASNSGTVHLIDEARAKRLIANGTYALPQAPPIDLIDGQQLAWIEIPPIVRNLEGNPVRPAWIPPAATDSYFEALASELPQGLDSLPGPPDQFIRQYSLQRSPLLFLAGTDELGRDLFARTLVGGRLSIAVGITATLVSVTIGILYGGIAGYVGGKIDSLMMRLVDILYALPFLIFVILLMVVFPRSLLLLFLAIGAVEWLTTARIVRGEVLSLKKLPFVDAARCLGLSHAKILCRHILPNTLPPVIVYATLTVPTVILLESVLSFLGLGVQPPNSSWGVLLNEGAERMLTYPWMLIFPASLFAITLLSL